MFILIQKLIKRFFGQKKILVFVSGSKEKIIPFEMEAKRQKINVTCASFSDIEFIGEDKDEKYHLKVYGIDLKNFDVIYFRMIGKRLEDATLVADYARESGIKLADSLYTKSVLMPPSISKIMELKLLILKNLPVPTIYFGSLEMIGKKAEKFLGFPFVIKNTSGRKSRDVWCPETKKELDILIADLKQREKVGERFFAQKFIRASQRIRMLVAGNNVIGAITRPTKWRKRLFKNQIPEAKKEAVTVLPSGYKKLALDCAKAVSLQICGVDVLVEDETEKAYVIEANAAPSWKLIAKDTGVNVEKQILQCLRSI